MVAKKKKEKKKKNTRNDKCNECNGRAAFERTKVFITKTSVFKYTENVTNKKWKFQIKILMFYYISAQNIDWGDSNEYPQSMFLSRNNKNNAYPRKLQFYYIKVVFKGVSII